MSGENRVVADETRLLRDAGHEVFELVPERRTGTAGAAREGLGAVWSTGAAAEVRALIREHRPEVVHCHNLFPALSPAVLRAAAGGGAAVVMSLHNFRLLCLPATLLRDGAVCELCVGRRPWRGVIHRCYRGSRAASGALAASIGLHRALGTFDRVHLYLAVSEFVRAKHLEAGFAAERIAVKPNFAWDSPRREGPGEYFLFAGRLSPEKGGRTLLAAWRDRREPLLVVGDGPEREALRADSPGGVEFRAAVEPEEMPALLARARALVLPSLWYEGAPRIVIEAYAAGVPVVASSIGALPGMVEDGVSGLLVPPGDAAALAAAVERLVADDESERLGDGARRRWSALYTPEQNLRELETAYARAIELSRA